MRQGRLFARILGLEVGADNYVVKPFVVREVVLRVVALANRLAEPRAAICRRAEWHQGRPDQLDPATHDVRIDGAPGAAAAARVQAPASARQ